MDLEGHGRLARKLVEACGGVNRACEIAERSRAVMYGYMAENPLNTMPAEVVDRLELDAGKPIYSQFLAERFAVIPRNDGDLHDTAELLCFDATALLKDFHTGRKAIHGLTLSQRNAALRHVDAALEALAAIRAGLCGEDVVLLRPVGEASKR